MALNVVVFVGGVGGAKLAYGLAHILPPENLTIIVNTGDDFWHYGLRVCPDLDTIMYTLSGLVNKTNGWGIDGDTRAVLDAMQRYGEAPWFQLGDQDIATHLLRTQALADGETLTQITTKLNTALGVQHRVLPMTDAPVATMVDTVDQGELAFQTYFVRHRWQPVVKSLRFEGVEAAAVTPEVRAALQSADVILIGPSNPWLSIAPILAVPGMRELILAYDVPRVAVSPIIGGKAVKGPAAKLMVELGYEQTAQAVADYYGEVINGFVVDTVDAGLSLGVQHTANFEIIMNSESDRISVAKNVLQWIQAWV
ncbi:MAG: 2-phospho-L-lactate transferase [Anaerolineaceae bacterium]|nr:2-phospho-L-lactate transferase [Anaerolineaceae bacterium]